MPEALCQERNRARPDRDFGPHVVRQQRSQLRRSLRALQREGFRRVGVLRDPAELDAAEVTRHPLWIDRSAERGPFDVIGDVHGCSRELVALLRRLGYEVTEEPGGARAATRGAAAGVRRLTTSTVARTRPRC